MSEITVNAQNFDEKVLRSQKPVLVDFWAPWCAPCRMLAPSIEKIALEYEGRAVVAKVNVDECPTLAVKYGVTNIPALIVFRGGRVSASSVGYRPKEEIEELLGR